MPRISRFYGIVIERYCGDHPPPHFHARCSGESAKIAIATGELLAGSFSNRALRLVRPSSLAARRVQVLEVGKVAGPPGGSLHLP